MTKITKDLILKHTAEIYAASGFETFSIRRLASKMSVAHSVIYHYFKDEKELLKEMFKFTNRTLGEKRKRLPKTNDPFRMFRQRIYFQIDNLEMIVAVLKYFLAHRPDFKRNQKGFIPDKSALHIEEVLAFGTKTGTFNVRNIKDDAKIITHAINGFLLEFYPHKPEGRERKELADRIYKFLIRAITGKEVKK